MKQALIWASERHLNALNSLFGGMAKKMMCRNLMPHANKNFNKNSCDLLTAITHTEIRVARCIFLIKRESLSG